MAGGQVKSTGHIPAEVAELSAFNRLGADVEQRGLPSIAELSDGVVFGRLHHLQHRCVRWTFYDGDRGPQILDSAQHRVGNHAGKARITAHCGEAAL